ncbi:MAG: FG-GAP-like repeat-containing protein [Polyangiales bacterium]
MSPFRAALLGVALLASACDDVPVQTDAGDEGAAWSRPRPDPSNGLDDNEDGVVDEQATEQHYPCADPARCTCARWYVRCGDECFVEGWVARCGDACVNPRSDDAHCGACGHACREGDHCSQGVCRCAEGLLARCGDACLDVSSDTENCGACGHICPATTFCDQGGCRCPPGYLPTSYGCRPNGVACEPACWRGWHCYGNKCLCNSPCPDGCADQSSDARNCGACGNRCPEGATCVEGRCACPTGRVPCGGRCVDPASSVAHCGACGRACAPGQGCYDGTCRLRLGLPAASERVGTRRPTLRWPGGRGVADVCADRACTRVLESVPGGVAGGATLTRPLAPGVYFWRIRTEGAGALASSAVSFRVDRRDVARPGLLPPAPDLNGDGFADVIVATETEAVAFFGASSGPMGAGVRVAFSGPSPGVSLRLTDDPTGDGVGDVLVSRGSEGDLITGDVASANITRRVLPVGAGARWPIFDVNGDAVGDSLILTAGATVLYGDDEGTRAPLAGLETGTFTAVPVGDTNGDGYRDVALGTVGASAPRVALFFGSAVGLDRSLRLDLGAAPAAFDPRPCPAGDLNGDGFADLLVAFGGARVSLYLGGAGAATLHREVLPPADASLLAGAAGDVDGDGPGDLVLVLARRGELWWYRGGAAGLTASAVVHRDPRWADVAAIGAPRDVDGDGFDDVVLAAPSRGVVYVLHGAAADTLARVETLAISPTSTPVLSVL